MFSDKQSNQSKDVRFKNRLERLELTDL